MEHSELVEALRSEGLKLGAVRTSPAEVPACAPWSVADLIHHVGTVHRFQTTQLRAAGSAELQNAPQTARPADEDLTDWYVDGLLELLDTLAETDPAASTPTWFGARPAVFWARRAAVETAIHRWDAQSAAGTPEPIDAVLAAEGIDEVLEVIVPFRLSRSPWDGADASIHLHATDGDGDGEWLLRLSGGRLAVSKEHARGDVAARGSTSDLLLLLTGRIPSARLEVFGDSAVLDRWQRRVAI